MDFVQVQLTGSGGKQVMRPGYRTAAGVRVVEFPPSSATRSLQRRYEESDPLRGGFPLANPAGYWVIISLACTKDPWKELRVGYP